MTLLKRRFRAELQKSANKGGWTFVIMRPRGHVTAHCKQ